MEKPGMESSSETATNVIALPEGDYGSLGIEAWSQLLETLEEGFLGDEEIFSLVIVDLDRVRYFGAGLIGWLVGLANRLNRLDARLQVRGDRLGLLKRVGLGGKFEGRAKANAARLTAVID